MLRPLIAGGCSLGIAVEFAPIAAARSRRIVAFVNPQRPSLPGADFIRLEDIDLVVENDALLCAYHGADSRLMAFNLQDFEQAGGVPAGAFSACLDAA